MTTRRGPVNRGGRPVKLTVDAALAVVAALCEGKRLRDAARAGGVGQSTLFRWLAAGRAGDPRYTRLVEAVDVAIHRGRGRQLDDFLLDLFRALS